MPTVAPSPVRPPNGRPSPRTLATGAVLLGTALGWASLVPESAPGPTAAPAPAPTATAPARSAEEETVARAKRAIADCRERFARVQDYTCTFVKRERGDDRRLSSPHVLSMKARTRPASVYFKYQSPKPGREAIFVAGRNGGRALVHDVGLGKLIAGTLAVDPRGRMAMENCRHPITEAGIGHLIETVAARWAAEMRAGETRVAIRTDAEVDRRPCTLIESTHPVRRPEFLFHSVRVYIDREHNVPIRFEAFDWPERPGSPPTLVEEYAYRDLRLDVGLTDRDFDPKNAAYAYGRF